MMKKLFTLFAFIVVAFVAYGNEICLAPNSSYEITGYETATVTITNCEEGATVYYEVYINGELDPQMSGSFTGESYSLNVEGVGTYLVYAIAKKVDVLADSEETWLHFTIFGPPATEQCATPKSTYKIRDNEKATVTITNNEDGARIYYEVYHNGSLIDDGSFSSSSSIDVQGEGWYTIHAFAHKDGKLDSDDGGLSFSIWCGNDARCKSPICTYMMTDVESATITITNPEEGATVYYEVYINGELAPNLSGSFSGESYSFDVEGDGAYVIHAVAKKEGMLDSCEGGVLFTILGEDEEPHQIEVCAAPKCFYEILSYQTATVTITNCEPDAIVYYEVYKNGSKVRGGSFSYRYSFNLVGEGNYKIFAIAKKEGKFDSRDGGLSFAMRNSSGTCMMPNANYQITGYETCTVTITNRQPYATVFWTVEKYDSNWENGEVVDSGSFTGDQGQVTVAGAGQWIVHCYAHIYGWNDSYEGGGVFFTIMEGDAPPPPPCKSPVCEYKITGLETATVTITNREKGATVHYYVYKNGYSYSYYDYVVDDGSFTGDAFCYTIVGEGTYEIVAIAHKVGFHTEWSSSSVDIFIFEGQTPPQPLPTEQCTAPKSTYLFTDYETATVTITNREEGATVYYEVYKNDTCVGGGTFTGDAFSFDVQGEGEYVIHAIAHKAGKIDSDDGGLYFYILSDSYVSICESPNSVYAITDFETVTVTITNREEGASGYFEVYKDNVLYGSGSFIGERCSFNVTGAGQWVVPCYAQIDGKLDSPDGGVFFTIFEGEEPVQPTEQCVAPESIYEITGNEKATVDITKHEENAVVCWDVVKNGSCVGAGLFAGDSYSFDVEGAGDYDIHAVARKANKIDSPDGGVIFTIGTGNLRGDVNGNGKVNMDDLTTLINYLLDNSTNIDIANSAIINNVNDTVVNMDDLTTLINYLLTSQW